MEIRRQSPILQSNSSSLKQALLPALFALLLASCATPKTFEYRDIKNIRMESMGFETSTLAMDLVYYNPNGFGVDLKNVDCEVYVDKTYLGKFLLDTLMHIPRMAEFNLPSKIKLDMKSVMKNGLNLLVSKEVLINVKGSSKVGRGGFYKVVPFEYEERRRFGLY